MAAADFQWTSCARLRKFRVLISTPRAKRSTRPFCSPHPHAPPSAYLSPLRQSPPGPTSLNPHLHPPSQEPAGLPRGAPSLSQSPDTLSRDTLPCLRNPCLSLSEWCPASRNPNVLYLLSRFLFLQEGGLVFHFTQKRRSLSQLWPFHSCF